jgi:FAD/FMN-containing dehydrogenase
VLTKLPRSQVCTSEPRCVVRPTCSEDVSKAIRIVKYYEVLFAVRSSGSSPNPGWSSIGQEGILIDLSQMNTVTLSDGGDYASIGPGGRWGDVYDTLDQYQTSVVGSQLPTVGVAGLVLGGGYFHTSNEFGLAADNVKNFEVSWRRLRYIPSSC